MRSDHGDFLDLPMIPGLRKTEVPEILIKRGSLGEIAVLALGPSGPGHFSEILFLDLLVPSHLLFDEGVEIFTPQGGKGRRLPPAHDFRDGLHAHRSQTAGFPN